MADSLDFLRADFQPNRSATFSQKITTKWTIGREDTLRYADQPADIVGVPSRGKTVAALLLSADLAAKIRKALCLAHEYWLYQDEIVIQKAGIEENKLKATAWAEELKYEIELKKEEIERRGQATEVQRGELERLLQERGRNQDAHDHIKSELQRISDNLQLGQERWIKAWVDVERALDPVWVDAGIIIKYRPLRPNPRKRGRSESRGSYARSKSPKRTRRSDSRGRTPRSTSRSPTRGPRPSHRNYRSRSRSRGRGSIRPQNTYDRHHCTESPRRSRSASFARFPDTHQRSGSRSQDNERRRTQALPNPEFREKSLAHFKAKQRAFISAELARNQYHRDFAKHLQHYMSSNIDAGEKGEGIDVRDLFRKQVFIPKLEELSRHAEKERQEYYAVRVKIASMFPDLRGLVQSHTPNGMDDMSIDECNSAEMWQADKKRVVDWRQPLNQEAEPVIETPRTPPPMDEMEYTQRPDEPVDPSDGTSGIAAEGRRIINARPPPRQAWEFEEGLQQREDQREDRVRFFRDHQSQIYQDSDHEMRPPAVSREDGSKRKRTDTEDEPGKIQKRVASDVSHHRESQERHGIDEVSVVRQPEEIQYGLVQPHSMPSPDKEISNAQGRGKTYGKRSIPYFFAKDADQRKLPQSKLVDTGQPSQVQQEAETSVARRKNMAIEENLSGPKQPISKTVTRNIGKEAGHGPDLEAKTNSSHHAKGKQPAMGREGHHEAVPRRVQLPRTVKRAGIPE